MALFHDDEYDYNDNSSTGANILIQDSIQAYGDIDLELEKGGSCGKVISLANWKEGATVQDEASSPTYAPILVEQCDFILRISFNQHNHANTKRC